LQKQNYLTQAAVSARRDPPVLTYCLYNYSRKRSMYMWNTLTHRKRTKTGCIFCIVS